MKVALDISPVDSRHGVRGIGSYTKNLVREFRKKKWDIEFKFFEKPNSPPPAEVVHYPYFDLFFHTLPINSKSSRVVTIHDVIPLVFPKNFPIGIKGRINLFLQKGALRNAAAVICDSQTSKKDIVNKLSYPEDKIHVIYLAAGENFRKTHDQKKLSDVRKKYRLPTNFSLYVGDVNWNKNIHNLLRAVKLAKINLVMAGSALTDSNLPQTREIETDIKRLALEKQVKRVGYLNEEDLVNIYNLATLTVLPSYYEGFGLPVLESMACATPVVCSKVASLGEITDMAAIFCDPKDPSDIAKKITYVVNLPPKERERLSNKIQNNASKFTWHKVAQETIKVYKSLLK